MTTPPAMYFLRSYSASRPKVSSPGRLIKRRSDQVIEPEHQPGQSLVHLIGSGRSECGVGGIVPSDWDSCLWCASPSRPGHPRTEFVRSMDREERTNRRWPRIRPRRDIRRPVIGCERQCARSRPRRRWRLFVSTPDKRQTTSRRGPRGMYGLHQGLDGRCPHFNTTAPVIGPLGNDRSRRRSGVRASNPRRRHRRSTLPAQSSAPWRTSRATSRSGFERYADAAATDRCPSGLSRARLLNAAPAVKPWCNPYMPLGPRREVV